MSAPSSTHRDLIALSTITSKGQTTVPAAVRQLLGSRQLQWRVTARQVIVEPVDEKSGNAPPDDPVLGSFLDMIDRDIAANRDVGAMLPQPVMAALQAARESVGRADYADALDEDEDDLLGP